MNFSTSFFAGAPPVMPAFISCWMEQDVLRHAHDLAVDLSLDGLEHLLQERLADLRQP